MIHYSDQDITSIKDNISASLKKVRESIVWVENNLKYEEKYDVLLKLKNVLNTFTKIDNNIDSKPVIAIFGGSQVGKSYLIKNLLSLKGQPFMIKNKDVSYDFLKDINPQGVGAESTGVVTRFTISNEIKFSEFAVKINLLTPKDLLIIILDSFFLDLKKITSFINSKDLNNHIIHFETQYSSHKQGNLTEFDILEIKEYFENHLGRHSILFEGLKETRFFERIGKIINGFDFKQWSEIFQVLWNNKTELTNLFSKLISGLVLLEFDLVAYLSFQSVLRGDSNGGILDVKRLDELNNSNKLTIVKRDNGNEVQIDLSLIAALTAELIFSIPNELAESKKFLKNSDLLDFPGARSRLAIGIDDIEDEIIPKMLLRGKVSYLFNKYSDDFNINNLLFCTNDSQLNVNEIPTLLFNWISKNIGENSQDRTLSLKDSVIPPLFVVFTFFNNQLEFDITNDFEFANDYRTLDYKWDTRFNRFFKDEIVTQTRNWHIDWKKTDSNFKNFYLLRDFKYSKDSFNGFEEKGYELNKREERIPYLEKLKESFINFEFVKKHFDNPHQSWEDSAYLNQDGSEAIINNLGEVSNNFTKTNHYKNKIDLLIDELSTELNKHIHDDDLSVLRSKSMKEVNNIQFSLNFLMSKDITAFNKLIELFSLKPVEIYNLLNENIVSDINKDSLNSLNPTTILQSQYHEELKDLTSKSEVFKVLMPHFYLNTPEDVEIYLLDREIKIEELLKKPERTSKSKFYIDLMLNYWNSKINDERNCEYFLKSGFTKNNFEFLVNHLNQIINRKDLKNKLERILNDVVSELYVNHGIEEFLAETFSLIINDIIINFDFNYFSNEESLEIDNLHKERNFKFYKEKLFDDPLAIEKLFNNDSEVSVGNIIALEKYNKWIEYLRISLLVNCGFINYDEQANEQLKSITDSFTSLKLN